LLPTLRPPIIAASPDTDAHDYSMNTAMNTRSLICLIAVIGSTLMLSPAAVGRSDTRSLDVTILQVDGEGVEGLIVWIANGQGQRPKPPVAVTAESGSAALALTPEQ
jgi:hypothetical protein